MGKINPAGCAPNGTYQNGAYWATPLSYIASAMLATDHANFLEELLAEAIVDFKSHGEPSFSHSTACFLHSAAWLGGAALGAVSNPLDYLDALLHMR
jgi:hypothetical protein